MSIPEPRVGHISFTYKNYVGVLGGYHDRMGEDRVSTNYSSVSDLWIYDTDLEKWILKITDFKNEEDKFYGMSGASCQIYKDNLYIFAGFTYTSRTNNLYLLDMKTYVWSKIQNCDSNMFFWTPAPRDKLVTWLFDNKIYFFGGYGPKLDSDSKQKHLGAFILDNNNETNGWNNDIFAFDILKNSWLPMSPKHGTRKPIGRSWHSFTAINDSHIFLYGGFTTEGEILSESVALCRYFAYDGWLLDTISLTWNPIEINFTGPRLWHSSTLTQHGEVFIFGGSLVNIMQSQPTRQSNEILLYRPSPKSLVRKQNYARNPTLPTMKGLIVSEGPQFCAI